MILQNKKKIYIFALIKLITKYCNTMSKKTKKNAVLDYVNAVKKADREREIAEHGKLVSTRPTKIKKSKKVYNRQENKKIRSSEYGTSDFFCVCSGGYI